MGTSSDVSSSSSLESILADARKMREAAKGESAVVEEKEEETGSLKSSAINVLSTIVTVDFFIVVALLLWFFTGIFFSYVFKNDSIYTTFAGIFEPVAQPALGVLML